eukprot:tig00000769_g4027.t1
MDGACGARSGLSERGIAALCAVPPLHHLSFRCVINPGENGGEGAELEGMRERVREFMGLQAALARLAFRCQVGWEDVELAAGASLAQLAHLDLSDHPLAPDAFAALCRAAPRLESLALALPAPALDGPAPYAEADGRYFAAAGGLPSLASLTLRAPARLASAPLAARPAHVAALGRLGRLRALALGPRLLLPRPPSRSCRPPRACVPSSSTSSPCPRPARPAPGPAPQPNPSRSPRRPRRPAPPAPADFSALLRYPCWRSCGWRPRAGLLPARRRLPRPRRRRRPASAASPCGTRRPRRPRPPPRPAPAVLLCPPPRPRASAPPVTQ